ncbi:MAG: septum formation initiator family protein [Proteobacteria bacterium]|nr:septum formation initiator family protein [Pseudomonadota bacterium]MDA0993386.1 septum formation initiator family protein [Pseudomonadota bacterium]
MTKGFGLLEMRWIMLVLAIAGLAMQGQLWLFDSGVSKSRDLHNAVLEQSRENEDLRNRNAALEAEVVNLKKGKSAAEERARTDLGMIGRSETFYQVVPAGRDRLLAHAPRN